MVVEILLEIDTNAGCIVDEIVVDRNHVQVGHFEQHAFENKVDIVGDSVDVCVYYMHFGKAHYYSKFVE